MTAPQTLQPTLWRTCRVLANRQRLRMIELLVNRPELMVTAVANQLALPLPVASLYLRGLEARGLLHARRRGGCVFYRLRTRSILKSLEHLLKALRLGFRRDPAFAEWVFRCATAFTHPRRIDIYRCIAAGNGDPHHLRTLSKTSRFAMARHLGKLEARGFICQRQGQWQLVALEDPVARALGRLAQQ